MNWNMNTRGTFAIKQGWWSNYWMHGWLILMILDCIKVPLNDWKDRRQCKLNVQKFQHCWGLEHTCQFGKDVEHNFLW